MGEWRWSSNTWAPHLGVGKPTHHATIEQTTAYARLPLGLPQHPGRRLQQFSERQLRSPTRMCLPPSWSTLSGLAGLQERSDISCKRNQLDPIRVLPRELPHTGRTYSATFSQMPPTVHQQRPCSSVVTTTYSPCLQNWATKGLTSVCCCKGMCRSRDQGFHLYILRIKHRSLMDLVA